MSLIARFNNVRSCGLGVENNNRGTRFHVSKNCSGRDNSVVRRSLSQLAAHLILSCSISSHVHFRAGFTLACASGLGGCTKLLNVTRRVTPGVDICHRSTTKGSARRFRVVTPRNALGKGAPCANGCSSCRVHTVHSLNGPLTCTTVT